jgi:hypothetical protein
MKLAHKRMRGNPVAFTDAIAGAVGKAERGAHRHKWQAIAMCVGVARQVRKSFAQFEELRSAPCLQNNKKVQKATEKDFKKFVPIAVATRSFYNTEATENRISVYGYGIGYFVGKKIPVARIPAKIKAKKGIDGVYALVKDKKREARELQDAPEAAGSSSTESRASEPDERASAARKTPVAPSERKVAAGESPAVSGERLTVKWILDNHLLIKMTKEEKEQYLDGSARIGQHRQLDTTYGGRGAHNLHDWEYVYGRDVDAGPSSREDNDNEADYEDEGGDEDAA